MEPDTYSPHGIRVNPDGRIIVPQVTVERAGSQSIPGGGAFTAIAWNNEVVDTDNMFDPGDPTRIRIRTPGIYGITVNVSWGGLAAGQFISTYLLRLGSPLAADDRAESWHNSFASLSYIGPFEADIGDILTVEVAQSDGVAHDITNDPTMTVIFLADLP